jgi:lysyl endopeptidase
MSATTTTSWGENTGPGDGSHARVLWTHGVTEPGSSGSPLFDASGRIIGQLHGGTSECYKSLPDWYGRISRSWEGGGEPGTRLRDWLDPANTGATTLDGVDAAPLLTIRDVSVVEGQTGQSQAVSLWSCRPWPPRRSRFNTRP